MYSLIGLVTVLTLSSRALSQCYFPNGGLAGSDTICNPNALVSSCCYDKQACLSNGLCVSDPLDAQKARLHRGTCSDKTWKSGNCPRQCTSIDNNGVPVYSCNQTNTDSYCCFDNCKCNDPNFETFSFPSLDVYTVTIIGEPFTQTHTPSSSSSSSPAPSSSSAALAETTNGLVPSTNPTAGTGAPSASLTTAAVFTSAASEQKSDSSVTIGVGVGVGVGAALLIGAGLLFFFWRRRKNKQQREPTLRDIHDNNPYANNMAADTHGIPQYAELGNSEAPPQFFPPTQKYAYFASENPSSAPQRGQPFDSPPIELATSPRHEAAELPASPSHGPKKDK
ncbi:hypothetical protein DM02DRAFT_616233 [Periconia macrospinosa]|uniref:Mid2 domain-containing protein n=1 Tax=Periconia macrospinosa TaxID=97972 RepID=A0A2V1DI99_9PLEO|nr:hypothetical protein DM02DRAFT_616233 [Periconia macrospinosa]